MKNQTPSSEKSYCLIAPHYSEAVHAFFNVIEALPTIGLTPLVLVEERDTTTQAICKSHDLLMVIVPRFSWRNQLNSVGDFFREPFRVRRFCRQLLTEYAVKALLLVDDRRFTELFLIHEAQKRNIPSLVLMWAATNPTTNMIAWRKKSLAYLHSSRWRILTPLVRCVAPQSLRIVEKQTVHWQHPLAVLTLATFTTYPPHPWIFGGGPADAVGVIGDHDRDILRNDGVPDAKIHITGHPRHDDMVNNLDEWQKNAPEKPYILLATPPIAHIKQGTRAGHVTPEQMNAYLHQVITELLSLSFELVVKTHPRDKNEDLGYLKGHSRSFEVIRDQPIAPLIANAELLVCQGSSVVFEACGLDKPVVTFDFYNTPGYDMWHQAGVSTHITQQSAFLDGITATLHDDTVQKGLKQQRQKFTDHYMRQDGQATQRVLDLINQLREAKS